MKELVCNYASIRFLPYRETGEFANIGVVLFCPEIDWFDFRLETRRARVHAFFPELEHAVFKTSLAVLDRELSRQRTANEIQIHGNHLTPEEAGPRMNWFKGVIRRRESIVHFGEPGVMVATDPREALNDLFQDLVRRQFAHEKEYREVVMRKRLARWLTEWKYDYERNKRVGNTDFHVILPFVHSVNQMPEKALKPFDLDRGDTSEIYNHGDIWIAKVRRLVKNNTLPRELIFTVNYPDKPKPRKAANEVCRELQQHRVRIVDYTKQDELRKAACLVELST